MENSPANVTELLLAWSTGDREALAKLTPLVYDELYRLARLQHGPRTAGTPAANDGIGA